LDFNPNGPDWGLAQYSLMIEPCRAIAVFPPGSGREQEARHELRFQILLLLVRLQMACDFFILKSIQAGRTLRRSAALVARVDENTTPVGTARVPARAITSNGEGTDLGRSSHCYLRGNSGI
jgi:hypothetical protein